MSKNYIEDQQFKGQDFSIDALPQSEYDGCTFTDCIFLNGILNDIQFSNCTFSNCDLSMAKLRGTAFRDVQFNNCKMLGLRFDECHNFSLSFNFDRCVLNFSSFYKQKLPKTRFKDCKMEEVEFVEADFSNALFSNCELRDAVFENTRLEGADLRTAYNFSIDPEKNKIRKAHFSTQNIAGLLRKYQLKID